MKRGVAVIKVGANRLDKNRLFGGSAYVAVLQSVTLNNASDYQANGLTV